MLARYLVALVVVLLVPTASAAAAPFTAGAGQEPSIAVGTDGTGHVAWMVAQTTDDSHAGVGYCRIPAGATACNKSVTFRFPDGLDANAAGQVKVFAPAPNKVVIVAACWNCPDITNRTFRYESITNGESWADEPVEIGETLAPEGHGLWLEDAQLFMEVSTGKVKAAKAATPGEGVAYATGCICSYYPEVARVPGSNKLVAATNDLDFVKYGVYTGTTLDPVDINDTVNWDKEKLLTAAEGNNRDTSLASGPNGLALTYLETATTPDRVGLRRFDPLTNTFGAPSYVDGEDTFDNDPVEPDSFQDPAGRMHFVWRVSRDDGRLRYRVTDTSGNNLSVSANLAAKEAFSQPEVAAGADGKGFAVWSSGVTGNTNIRVVPLEPFQETPVTQTPTPTPTPVPRPPIVTPPVIPPAYSGPTRTTTSSAPGGSTVSFGVPRSCVAPGSTYKVRLGLKAKKRKGRVVVKLTRVDFYIGTRIAKTDRKAPFVQTLTVAVGTTSGIRINLRARGQIKIRTGKPRSKSVRATIRVC